MTPTKNTYDNDADKRHSVGHGSEADELRRITGIGADEEGAMEREAGLGAVEDYANQGSSSDSASPKSLGKAEITGQKPAGDEPEDTDNGDEPKKKRGFWSKKKAAAGVTGAVLLGGGGFFGFSLIAPTASVIQLGSILQSTHLQRKEDDADNRFMQLARYLYFRGGNRVERSRLGLVGNTVADRVQARVTKQTGLTPVYDRGELKGFTYDDNTYDKDGNRTGSRGGTSSLERNGISITETRDGKPFISTEGLSDRDTRRLNRAIVKESGIKGVSASLSAAIGGKRAGLTRHPVKQIVRKQVADYETRRAERKKERAEYIKQGETTNLTTSRGDTEGGNTDPDSDPDGVQNEANDILGDAAEAQEANAAGDGSGTASLREKITGKLSGGVAAVVGIGCIARGIDQGAETIKQDQVIFPMMRMSMEMVSLASQMKSGQDIDMTEVGFYADQLYDTERQTGVNNSMVYRESTGQTGGTDADETAKTATTFSTPFSFLNDGSPLAEGLGAVCNVLGNQVVGLVLNILGGPISYVSGLIIEQVTGPIIDDFTEWLAGDPINPDAKGAEYVNYMFYGGALVANQQFVAAGGRELSDAEVAQIKTDEAEDNQFDFKSESIAQRVFDVNDNRSLMGSFISKVNPNVSAGATNALATIINPSSYFGAFSSLLTPKASAATATYKYPFKMIGYSVAENNNPKVADPVKNANDVIDRIMPAHSDYKQRAIDCYGAIISDDYTDVRMDLQAKPNPYSRAYPSYNCSDTSDDWLQTRRYISDTVDVDTTACREGEAESCERLGLTSATTDTNAATGATGATGTLPTGTAKELAQQIANNPNIVAQNQLAKTGFDRIVANGKANECGGPEIDPRILGVMLQMAQKYKIYYNVFTDFHGCDGGQHGKGKAVDLVGANPLDGSGGGTGSFIHFDEWNTSQKVFYGKFLTDLGATLAASGGGALGQGDCATRYGVNYTKATGVLYFNGDSCNHQHVDTR